MKHLVRHAIKNDLDGIVARSLRNCHTKGLNSIVLLRDGKKSAVRLFVAHRDHDLWP